MQQSPPQQAGWQPFAATSHERNQSKRELQRPQGPRADAKGATVTASSLATAFLAANPGPLAHLALLGVVAVIGLIVYAVVRMRRKRDAAQAEHDDLAPKSDYVQGEHPERSRPE
jgi:hypothetical protein